MRTLAVKEPDASKSLHGRPGNFLQSAWILAARGARPPAAWRENIRGDVYLAVATAGMNKLVIMGTAIAFVWI
jgi:hypothetical protein